MKNFLICIFAAALLAACHKDEENNGNTTETADRTVIVYMAGETNLSSPFAQWDFAQWDIDEMIKGVKDVSGNNRLVVFVDRASTEEKPFIARIKNDKNMPVDTLYKYQEDFYSSAPDNFREVIERTASLCPAKSYGLVLWGHADGWIINRNGSEAQAPRRAYGIDNGDNSTSIPGTNKLYKWLNIPDMRKVMEQLPFKWKFIFCDCCNMMGAEVAYELKDVTEYLIGSPAEITGVGAPYDAIVKDLFYGNDDTMYKAICDDYWAQVTHEQGNADEHMPISVVRTAGMEGLATATRQVLPLIAEYTQQPYAMTELMNYYNASLYKPERERVMFDMQAVILHALASYPEAYQSWHNAFQQAVIYSRKSVYWHANTVNFNSFDTTEEEQGVMSMFFPLSQYNSTISNYNTLIKQMQWYQAVGWSEVGW